MLIERFLLRVTSEALWANIGWKLAFLNGAGQFQPNFYVVLDIPREVLLYGQTGH